MLTYYEKAPPVKREVDSNIVKSINDMQICGDINNNFHTVLTQ